VKSVKFDIEIFDLVKNQRILKFVLRYQGFQFFNFQDL